jgi:hypothetical protein
MRERRAVIGRPGQHAGPILRRAGITARRDILPVIPLVVNDLAGYARRDESAAPREERSRERDERSLRHADRLRRRTESTVAAIHGLPEVLGGDQLPRRAEPGGRAITWFG